MLTELLADNIHFSNQQLAWQDAITLASQPLLDQGYITQNYVDDIVKNIETNGSYLVLVPEIALPHARSNGNVSQTSMSFLKLNNPVIFPDGQPVSVMLVLASADNDGHLDVLVEFAETLTDKEQQHLLKTATTKEQILTIFN
ncbi:PTS sugar transporter subunit IIA [Zophobihabitans entericus]|uniref:Ascorbate-specific PTS system EIIA component n=1 Tax=Zophobihabitans entericus TaxID=1635327 RepID=A0A6G9I9S1_9GAMM|nr:PTS sugar transporter subunit IIA [Zophobihabitans entericus]QIQ20579.1 PTS sugar transporter subunit IIA [Zophobihabitans entericus]